MSITLHNLSPLDEMDWAGPRGHLTAAHTTGHHASVDRSLSGRADGVTPLVFVCTPGLHITCPATVATSRTVPSPLWTDQPFTPTDQIVFCRPFLEPSACTYGCVRKKKNNPQLELTLRWKSPSRMFQSRCIYFNVPSSASDRCVSRTPVSASEQARFD